jgi:hypothetical protein
VDVYDAAVVVVGKGCAGVVAVDCVCSGVVVDLEVVSGEGAGAVY